MIAEQLLNAVLHIFAMQASRLTGTPREKARRRVLAYLNHHVGLANAETYISLLDDLTELHETESDKAIVDQIAPMTERLKRLLYGVERYAAALRFMELAVLAADDALPRRIAGLLGTELEFAPESVTAILSFIAHPEACSQPGCETRRLGGDDSFQQYWDYGSALSPDATAAFYTRCWPNGVRANKL